jgi:hypothetical protein
MLYLLSSEKFEVNNNISTENEYDRSTPSRQEREEIEDMKLLHLMLDAKEEGAADTEETLSKLGITKR